MSKTKMLETRANSRENALENLAYYSEKAMQNEGHSRDVTGRSTRDPTVYALS